MTRARNRHRLSRCFRAFPHGALVAQRLRTAAAVQQSTRRTQMKSTTKIESSNGTTTVTATDANGRTEQVEIRAELVTGAVTPPPTSIESVRQMQFIRAQEI